MVQFLPDMTPTHNDIADELARALEQIEAGPTHGRSCTWNPREIARQALTAYRTRPAPETAGEAGARGWSIEYRPGGRLYGLFDTQEDAQAEADKVGGTARAVALSTAIAPAQRMSEEQERAGFEQWAKDYGRIFLKRAGDGYEFGYTNEAWVAWKARAAWGVKLEGGEA